MPLTKVPKTATQRGYVLYLPENYDSTKKYPVLLIFPGVGQGGDGTDTGLQIVFDLLNAQWYPGVMQQLKKRNTIVIVMQINWGAHWQNKDVDDALAIAAQYSIDTTKIHLNGLSLGGEVVWGYPASSLSNGTKFASVTPICCVQGLSGNYCNIKSPVFAFHAQDDPVVSVNNTNGIINSIIACTPLVQPKKKIYPSGGHDIWWTVWSSDEFWDFITGQAGGNAGTVTPPTPTKKLLFTIKVYDDGSTEKV